MGQKLSPTDTVSDTLSLFKPLSPPHQSLLLGVQAESLSGNWRQKSEHFRHLLPVKLPAPSPVRAASTPRASCVRPPRETRPAAVRVAPGCRASRVRPGRRVSSPPAAARVAPAAVQAASELHRFGEAGKECDEALL
jgi:hypothetical protein